MEAEEAAVDSQEVAAERDAVPDAGLQEVQAGVGIYDKLLKKYGVDAARMYLEANLTAVEKYRELCSQIDCDFERRDLEDDSFGYSLCHLDFSIYYATRPLVYKSI